MEAACTPTTSQDVPMTHLSERLPHFHSRLLVRVSQTLACGKGIQNGAMCVDMRHTSERVDAGRAICDGARGAALVGADRPCRTPETTARTTSPGSRSGKRASVTLPTD